jgi:phenylalanyl-tRNA synthetase beta chain
MLFEVGRVFSKPRNEHESLAGLLFGRTELPLSGRRNIDLLAAKGVIQNLLASLNVGEPRFLTNDIPTFLHPGRAARITLPGEEMGLLGELAPTVCDDLSSSATLIMFEIDIDKLQRLGRTKHLFTPPGRFPASKRDLSLLAPIELPEEKIRRAITSEKLIDSVLLYDLYQGEQVSEHEKSLTYEISLRADDHTLTDQEVDRSVHRIMKRLAKLDARLRE